MKKRRCKVTFELVENFDFLIDEESFEKDFGNDLLKLCRWLYENEGVGFLNEDLELVKAEFVGGKP